MAEPSGTWVKLGFEDWKYLPPQVRDYSKNHNMTWKEACELAEHVAGKPNASECMRLGTWIGESMSNHAQLVSDPTAEVYIVTPRKVNEKIPSRQHEPEVVQHHTITLSSGRVITLGAPAIKLQDGRTIPLGAPPPPSKPPGHFMDKDLDKPPGTFMTPPPGNFTGGQPQPPPPPPPVPPINLGGVKTLANYDEEEVDENQTKKVAGVNSWWSIKAINEYLRTEDPGAKTFTPWNAFIFDSVHDFVSSLRAEASYPDSHFKWPEQAFTYELMLAMAIHHLPPGYHVSIKNGRPCPKELLISTKEWPGETADYYHGTTAYSLLRGIIRGGLKATFGAGEAATQTAWGQATPMVYLSRLIECACYYPSHEGMWTEESHKVNGHNYGKPSGGEIIARDGTPPIRVVLRCISQNTKQLWHKKDGANDQRGFMSKHVYISHIMIYAMPPSLVSGPHSRTSWKMYNSEGNPAISENLMIDANSMPFDKHNNPLVPRVYGVGTDMATAIPVNITQKKLIQTRYDHRPTLIIKDWIEVQRDNMKRAIGPDRLPPAVLDLLSKSPLQDVVPVLENTKYSIDERVPSDWHTANIADVLANHQLGNVSTQLYTQVTRPDTRPAKGSMSPESPTESSVGKDDQPWSYAGWRDTNWSSQSWDAREWTSHSSHSWQEKEDWGTAGYKKWVPKKPKTGHEDSKPSSSKSDEDRAKKWRHEQTTAYTTHYRNILATVIKPFPYDYYEINKGTYPMPLDGEHCTPSNVYPIPAGEIMEYGKQVPEPIKNDKLPTDDTPLEDLPDSWKDFKKTVGKLNDIYKKPAIEDSKNKKVAAENYNNWLQTVQDQQQYVREDEKVTSANPGINIVVLTQPDGSPIANKDTSSPASPVAKWHKDDKSGQYTKEEIEPTADDTMAEESGLALTNIKTDDSLPIAEAEMDTGINPGSSTPTGSTTGKDFVMVQPATYAQPPLRETMETQNLLATMYDTLNSMKKLTSNITDEEAQESLRSRIKGMEEYIEKQLLDKSHPAATADDTAASSSAAAPTEKKKKKKKKPKSQEPGDVDLSESDISLPDDGSEE